MHPAIAALIEGGTSIEYGAHLVPEIGFHGVPKRLTGTACWWWATPPSSASTPA